MKPNSYLERQNCRSSNKDAGTPAGKIMFSVECSRCASKISHTCPLGDEALLDKNFSNRGWDMGRKPICPSCRKSKESTVASKSPGSASAVKAQVALVNLLSENFDVERGSYSLGWDDKRVARETGLSLDFVTQFRRDGFGEIKEPEELAKMRADIRSVEQLIEQSNTAFAQQIAELRGRLGALSSKFAA